jgi:hypothetical protein
MVVEAGQQAILVSPWLIVGGSGLLVNGTM